MSELFVSTPKRQIFMEVKKRTLDFFLPAGSVGNSFNLRITYELDDGAVEQVIRCASCNNRNIWEATEEWTSFWQENSVGNASQRLYPPLNPAELKSRLRFLPAPTHISETFGMITPYIAPIYLSEAGWSDTPKHLSLKTETSAAKEDAAPPTEVEAAVTKRKPRKARAQPESAAA